MDKTKRQNKYLRWHRLQALRYGVHEDTINWINMMYSKEGLRLLGLLKSENRGLDGVDLQIGAAFWPAHWDCELEDQELGGRVLSATVRGPAHCD